MKKTFAADLVETLLLCANERALGFQQLEDLLKRLEFDPQFIVATALNQMQKRSELLGDLYPFEALSYAVRKSPTCEDSAYVSLLSLSPEGLFRQLFDSRDIDLAAIDFERIVAYAMKSLAGPTSESIRFGWPSDVGRPMEFPDAITWLGEKMGIRLGRGFRPPRRKDGGVDIVSWRKFKDGKTAFPIYLVQCTIQSDLRKKSDDIDLRNWSNWLDFSRDPQPVLAVPHEISGQDEAWNELGLKSLVLDRPRLIELCHEVDDAGHTFRFDNVSRLSLVRDYLEAR
jgi:hypothetical protein